MITLKIIWAFVKKYWQVVALVVGAIAAVFVFHERENTFTEDYNKIQDSHAKEIDAINKANDVERTQLVANQQKLQAALDAVQKQYDANTKQLDDNKKAEITQIIKDHGNDPVALAQKLSESTGFTVILPKDS